ncbi:MAG TPA: hypothetical protein PKC28_12210 [Bdellovibrionales bacterium]|nr:hypothetical protein [Bdellovibrionales bacterium]
MTFLFEFLLVAVTVQAAPESVASAYKEAAKLNDASFVTEVVFAKSSSELSADGKSALRDVLKEAQHKGSIEEVKILSWADQEYPRGRTALGNDARKLADERALEIKGYIEDNSKGLDFDTYNMAERPTTLRNLLKSQNSQVKRSLEVAGLAHPDQTNMPPKAGRALVMFILK